MKFDPSRTRFILCMLGFACISSAFPAAAGDVAFGFAADMGGVTNDNGEGIVVDASGNVYITGGFSSTADFDPDPGMTTNLTSEGDYDIFVQKLDSSGNLVWAKGTGGMSADYAWGIALDASGNVYITGTFIGTADFDPDPGMTANLTSAGTQDIFVCKLDSSGNFVWAKAMGGTGQDFGHSIAVDVLGNVFTTGFFNDTADFDPDPGMTTNLISAGSADIFVSKLDSSGNFVWARSMGDTSVDRGFGIAVDASSNVYTTGYFSLTVDFDPNPGMTTNLTVAGGQDIYVQKLDSSGNFVWAKAMGGPVLDEGRAIAVDASGNVHTTGRFRDTADFDPDPGMMANLVSTGGSNVFVSKLDSSGNFVWAKSMGADRGNGVAVDASGGV